MCCLLWRIYEMHPALSLKSGCDNFTVIYFFVMHEIFECTVFELLAKKHLSFFSCFAKKKILLMSLLTKINFMWENISAEGISCAIVFSFIIRPTFSKEQLFLFLPNSLVMKNDVWCDAMRYDMMIWCGMLFVSKVKNTGINTQTLHPLGNDFWVSSPFS